MLSRFYVARVSVTLLEFFITTDHSYNNSHIHSLSIPASSDLTPEELQKMTEQLGKELEERTAKKEKYKQKYLDEKQRAATMRDYYTGELERYSRDLELARCQLEVSEARRDWTCRYI